jgi:hypothetical protein
MVILFLFLLPDFVLSESRLRDSLFTLWTGHKPYNDIKVIENGTATSVLHCAVQCVNHKQCIAANFKESLKTCETHKSDSRELSIRIITQTGCDVVSGGLRGGVRGVRPPKIRKAYVIQR